MSETSAMYVSDVDDGLPFSFFLAIIIPLWWLYNQRERDIASEIKYGRIKEAPPQPPPPPRKEYSSLLPSFSK
jgi:hypothetical protein